MDIKAELEANRKKLQDITRELQKLEQQKQTLLQEALQLQGEARLLARLDKENPK